MLITGKIYKKVQFTTLALTVTVFITFLQNELEMSCLHT
jgi:hypothetical protein